MLARLGGRRRRRVVDRRARYGCRSDHAYAAQQLGPEGAAANPFWSRFAMPRTTVPASREAPAFWSAIHSAEPRVCSPQTAHLNSSAAWSSSHRAFRCPCTRRFGACSRMAANRLSSAASLPQQPRSVQIAKSGWPRPYRARMQAMMQRAAPGTLTNHLKACDAYQAPTVSVPATVVAGAEDRLVSPDLCEQLAERIGARYELVPDAGHQIPWERPDSIVDADQGSIRTKIWILICSTVLSPPWLPNLAVAGGEEEIMIIEGGVSDARHPLVVAEASEAGRAAVLAGSNARSETVGVSLWSICFRHDRSSWFGAAGPFCCVSAPPQEVDDIAPASRSWLPQEPTFLLTAGLHAVAHRPTQPPQTGPRSRQKRLVATRSSSPYRDSSLACGGSSSATLARRAQFPVSLIKRPSAELRKTASARPSRGRLGMMTEPNDGRGRSQRPRDCADE